MHAELTIAAAMAAALTTVVPVPARSAAIATARISVSSEGTQGSEASGRGGVAVSWTGRFVAFASDAPDLVPADTNAARDVFVRDLVTGTTERVSIATSGEEGNGESSAPGISGDGRLVVFQSSAANLVPGDLNGADDVFLHDRLTGETTLISTDRFDVQGNNRGETPVISADGGAVAWVSIASNLVPGDENRAQDIFLKDLTDGSVELITVAWDGEQADRDSFAPSVSADGMVVAFMSVANNLTPGFDFNGAFDIFIRDRVAGTTELASADPDGEYVEASSGYPSVSADGRFVAFESNGPLIPPIGGSHVYVREVASGRMVIADHGLDGRPSDGVSVQPAVSARGRFVAFVSSAERLVPGDSNGANDVFVRDLALGRTIRASVPSSGGEGDRESGTFGLAAAPAGRAVAFVSSATNLVPADTNGVFDVFLRGSAAVLCAAGDCTRP